MPPIYIMAAITVLALIALWGGLAYSFSGRQKQYLWLLLPGLPLSAVANLFVKRQAIILVGSAAHVQIGLGLAAPVWFLAFQVVITPLVEESIKILPLLLPPVRKMVAGRASALWVGLVLGVSFGLGEALFTAYGVAQSGAYDFLPWYAFTGFFNERIMVCFAHGVMTAALVIGLQRGGRQILYGFLTAVGLHLFLNAPTVLYQVQWISDSLYSISIVIPFIVMAVVFERIRRALGAPKDDQSGNEVVYWQRQHAQPGGS